MVHCCCAMGCPNRQGDKGMSFHRFPADPKQRERWVTATRKKGWRPTSASRLCGAHFVRGKHDKNPLSPDYVPSLFQHTSQNRRQQMLRAMLVFERKKRLVRRRRQRGELDGTVTVATDCLNGLAKEDEKTKQGQATPQPQPPPPPPPPPLAELVSPLKAAKSTSKAPVWWCVHEEQATKRYTDHMSKSHKEFNLQKCSLMTNPCHPYLTTTPDGITSCSCCGTGIVEVVCPVCMRATEPHALPQATPAKLACLERLKGSFDKMKHDSWYYQLQSQLHGCDKQYCDLVVWANKNLLIKRYFRNTPFFEAQRLKEEAKKELPGMLEKCPGDSSPPPPSGLSCCYCDRPAEGAVVDCDDLQCKIKTFHLKCLGLTRLPHLGWRCIECRKTRGSAFYLNGMPDLTDLT